MTSLRPRHTAKKITASLLVSSIFVAQGRPTLALAKGMPVEVAPLRTGASAVGVETALDASNLAGIAILTGLPDSPFAVTGELFNAVLPADKAQLPTAAARQAEAGAAAAAASEAADSDVLPDNTARPAPGGETRHARGPAQADDSAPGEEQVRSEGGEGVLGTLTNAQARVSAAVGGSHSTPVEALAAQAGEIVGEGQGSGPSASGPVSARSDGPVRGFSPEPTAEPGDGGPRPPDVPPARDPSASPSWGGLIAGIVGAAALLAVAAATFFGGSHDLQPQHAGHGFGWFAGPLALMTLLTTLAMAPFLGKAVPRHPSQLHGVKQIGQALFAEARGRVTLGRRLLGWMSAPRKAALKWASDRVLGVAGSDQFTKVQILQFTSVLPNIHGNNALIAQSLGEYFSDPRVKRIVRYPAVAASWLSRVPILRVLVRWIAGRITVFIIRNPVARRFFVGESADEAMRTVAALKRKGFDVTLDILGEKSLSQEDTDAYVRQYIDLLDRGVDNVSIKVTNLYSEFDPNAPERTKEAVKVQLRKILAKAKEKRASVTIDMEHYTVKDLTLEIFLEILAEQKAHDAPFEGLAIALQHYFPESKADLERIIKFSEDINKDRPAGRWIKPGVRLVKGANWYRDVVEHRQRGWPVPHFLRKAETDMQYERNVRTAMANTKLIRPAIATHNPRSIAVALDAANEFDVSPADFEFQGLYGMMPEPIAEALRGWGYTVRLYAPYGGLIPGLGYLMRRLLEGADKDSTLLQFNGSYDEESARRVFESPLEAMLDAAVAPAPTPRRLEARMPEGARRTLAELEPLLDPHYREVAGPFARYRDEMRARHEAALTAVQSLPGVRNEYLLGPRGQGYVIIDDPDASTRDIAERLAAPLAAGNRVFLSIADSDKRHAFMELLEGTELAKRVVFVAYSAPLVEDYVQKDVEFISYLGPPERSRGLRRLAFSNLQGQNSVKRFVSEVTPDYLMEFVASKSVAENTMRAGFAADVDVDSGGLEGFRNVAPVQLHRPAERAKFDAALADFARGDLGSRTYHNVTVSGRGARGTMTQVRSPIDGRVLGTVEFASPARVREAVAEAKAAAWDWAARSTLERAEALQRAARIMEDRRFELARWIVLEAGKTRESALADVDEAIDFLRYYALDALRLEREDQPRRGYRRPLGVAAVVAPWNFPLAILAGMTAGALVTGNAAIMKPAEQTPIIAYEFYSILREAGVPGGAIGLLPGGRDVGEALTSNPDVDLVMFTGSEKAGLAIKSAAEQADRGEDDSGKSRPPQVVVAEMGGKNAIIVDETADVDAAVEAVIASFLGFVGQKCSACSRVIVLPAVREYFERRLAAKFRSVVVGDPADWATMVGPLIDEAARAKVADFLADARREHLELLAERTGYGRQYRMAIFRGVPANSRLAQEEVFGPVLAVMYADTFEQALDMANSTRLALTAGVFTGVPSRMARAKERLKPGNLYINRRITGAEVGRQPFGGYGRSGTGFQAGGPDYLPQLTSWERP